MVMENMEINTQKNNIYTVPMDGTQTGFTKNILRRNYKKGDVSELIYIWTRIETETVDQNVLT